MHSPLPLLKVLLLVCCFSAPLLAAATTTTKPTTTPVPVPSPTPFAFNPSQFKASLVYMNGQANQGTNNNVPSPCDSTMPLQVTTSGTTTANMRLSFIATNATFMEAIQQLPPMPWTTEPPYPTAFRSTATCYLTVNVVLPKGWTAVFKQADGIMGNRLPSSTVEYTIQHSYSWPAQDLLNHLDSQYPSYATAEGNGPSLNYNGGTAAQLNWFGSFIAPKYAHTCGDGVTPQQLKVMMSHEIQNNEDITVGTSISTLGGNPSVGAIKDQQWYYTMNWLPCNPGSEYINWSG